MIREENADRKSYSYKLSTAVVHAAVSKNRDKCFIGIFKLAVIARIIYNEKSSDRLSLCCEISADRRRCSGLLGLR